MLGFKRMKQLKNYGDQRQSGWCAYCGGDTLTRDHVPSKVFLDAPYPENLPVVRACNNCNQWFSADEEYLACVIESVLSVSTSPSEIRRPNIQRILSKKPALAERIRRACRQIDGVTHFAIEEERVKNVFLKLGRGHALYELNEPRFEEPSSLQFAPLVSLADDVRDQFERIVEPLIWPEVGSRAMQRMAFSNRNSSGWLIVQPGRYRFFTFAGEIVIVRMVISEYLAGEIVWQSN